MTSVRPIRIGHRWVGPGHPAYIVAEVSANHNQDYKQAVRIIEAAAACGADAIKLQTYTPDTLTIDCDNRYFKIKGTLWNGRTLYDLYGEAFTPWEWHAGLRKTAAKLGLDFFSTPFDATAVDFLERLKVPVHKVASFENGDIPLLKKIARTGKPVIMSTGMATLPELKEAVGTLRRAGCRQLVLLKCTSAYPAPPEAANLRTIEDLRRIFGVPVGLSDHTPGHTIPVAAVTLGACVIEKHFTTSRSIPSPDSKFSLEPAELKTLVDAVRMAEKGLGRVSYGPTATEKASVAFRRSLFVVKAMRKGEKFTSENVRSIRPAYGLHTRHLEEVLGRRASRDIPRGEPLAWKLVSRS